VSLCFDPSAGWSHLSNTCAFACRNLTPFVLRRAGIGAWLDFVVLNVHFQRLLTAVSQRQLVDFFGSPFYHLHALTSSSLRHCTSPFSPSSQLLQPMGCSLGFDTSQVLSRKPSPCRRRCLLPALRKRWQDRWEHPMDQMDSA